MADLRDSFGCGERRGEAGGGAEEGGGTLPLESCLSFDQARLAVGAGHVQGGGVDDGQRLSFSSWGHREDRSDPQVLLSTTEQEKGFSRSLDLTFDWVFHLKKWG